MSFVGGFLRALIPLSLGVAILAHPYPARAEKRVALVIGNSGYEHITKLRNATNDAKLLTETLSRLGFEVLYTSDLKQKEMRASVRTFLRKLVEYGTDTVGLFYFAGHGVQVNGENFLIPVDAQIRDGS